MPCRVPEVLSTEGNEAHEIDAVHAAHDLLGLSNRVDYSPSIPGRDDGLDLPATSGTNSLGSTLQCHAPQSLNVTGMTSAKHQDSGSYVLNEKTSMILPKTMQPPPSLHQLPTNTATSLDYFDHPISEFDETPGQNPFLPEYFRNLPPFETFFSGQNTPRGIMDLSFDLDTGLTDLDLGLLDQYNFQVPFAAETPSTDAQDPDSQIPDSDSVPVRTEAFKQSIWRYLPQSNKDFGGAEQVNLAFADDKDNNRRSHITQRRVIAEKLQRVNRDQLMAFVLGTCSPGNVKRIASAFPSIELLDGLIQYFLTSPSIDAPSWLHMPTFSLSKIDPELLACIVSAGAVAIPDVPLRKLGFALHEASRVGVSSIHTSEVKIES